MEGRRAAGLLIFVATLELLMAIMIAEFIYPGYSVSKNYISDLGVWGNPSATIFNPAIILFGILILTSAYLLRPWARSLIFLLLFCLSAIGAIGVGLFTEEAGSIHAFFAFMTFLFGASVTILSYRYVPPPFSFLSVLLGVVSLASLVLFAASMDFGIGVGGMERMIAYPILLWSLGFGGLLMADSMPSTRSSS